jgi:hypothetical protein
MNGGIKKEKIFPICGNMAFFETRLFDDKI